MAAGACAPDNLNPTLNPGDNFLPGDADPGPPPYPVAVGTELSFVVNRVYLKDHAATPPGASATVSESKSAGQLCLRVDAVADHSTTNTASTLTATTRVAGTAPGEDIFFRRVDANGDPDPAATAAQIDDTTNPLWLWQLTFPTREHNLGSPTALTYTTRGPLTPAGELTSILFFDPRPSADGLWGGWLDPGTTHGADSMVSQLQAYLINTAGVDISDPTQVKVSFNDLRSSCHEHSTEASCQSNLCVWDSGACVPPHLTLAAAWRDTLTDGPAELTGNVIRSVAWELDPAGVLALAQEYVIKDLTGTGELAPFQTCAPTTPFNYSSGPCLQAQVLRRGGPFSSATCAFTSD